MSDVGENIFQIQNIQRGLKDPAEHRCLSRKELSQMGIQLVSQLEILHELGYTHGDLNLHKICFKNQRYSLINFSKATKFLEKNGVHKAQTNGKKIQGNHLFASENTVNLMTTSRKDDLESLIYILCYLHTGTLPTLEFLNAKIKDI
jgi:casein kinase I homolog HRR25